MRKAVIFATLMCVAFAGHAQRPAIAWMTGDGLLRLLTPVEPAAIAAPAEATAQTRQQLADALSVQNARIFEGYVTAVHDATEGKSWCENRAINSPKAETLDAVTREGLWSLPADQLKRNASDLLIEIWRERWSCPAGKRRQK